MENLIEWQYLEPGVKFRFDDRVLLVEKIHEGWIAICKGIRPEANFVLVERQDYNSWRKQVLNMPQIDLLDDRRDSLIAMQIALAQRLGVPSIILDDSW